MSVVAAASAATLLVGVGLRLIGTLHGMSEGEHTRLHADRLSRLGFGLGLTGAGGMMASLTFDELSWVGVLLGVGIAGLGVRRVPAAGRAGTARQQ